MITIQKSTKLLRVALAAVGLSLAAGCAEQNMAMPIASPAPAPKPELAGNWYQVFFDTNAAQVDAQGQATAKKVADVLATNTTARVTVTGKADRVGAAPGNLALSHRRADAVRDALVAAGVSADRIDTNWTGEAKPDVSTADQVAEKRNRVVDVMIVKPAL